MKTKSKLLLGLTAALAASVGVASTATFAWFTTSRTATVNFTKTSVYASKGNLAISYSAIANGGTSGSVAGNIATVNAASDDVTDISGNGVDFYRPDWIPGDEGDYANSFTEIHNSSSKNCYVTFNITLTNNGNAPLAVYLDTASDVFAHGSKLAEPTNTSNDNNAAAATRVAIYQGSTLKTLWQYATDSSYVYLAPKTGGKAYGLVSGGTTATTGYELTPLTDSGAADSTFHVGKFTKDVVYGFTCGSGQSLGTLAKNGEANSSLIYTIVIWLEGTCTTAKNTDTVNAIGGKVDVSLAIAAVDVSA